MPNLLNLNDKKNELLLKCFRASQVCEEHCCSFQHQLVLLQSTLLHYRVALSLMFPWGLIGISSKLLHSGTNASAYQCFKEFSAPACVSHPSLWRACTSQDYQTVTDIPEMSLESNNALPFVCFTILKLHFKSLRFDSAP